MSPSAYLFLGLTAFVGVLCGILAYAVVRFISAARQVSRTRSFEGGESALMTSAIEEAVRNLRAQEQALKARAEASERLSEQIVESLTSGLLVVDDRGMIRTLNPAGSRMLGLAETMKWPRRYRDVLSKTPELIELIEHCLELRTPVVRRTVRVDGAGHTSHLGLSVSPMGDGGAAQGAICLFTDLSTIKELEDQLRLKDSLARLGELTAGIAHEFRNGLATIHGYSRLVAPERLPDEYRPYLAGIRAETESLGEIVTNFLNFAKPAELMLTTLDLGAIVSRAADDLRPEAQAHGGDVVVRGEFGPIEGDEVLLRQAVSNLVRNALEACRDAGVPPQVALEGAIDRDARAVRVTVTDNGPGITAALAERMFRPFFTTKGKGTGLGLALVQKIIVTHNGRVAAVPGNQGGRMAFTLPLSEHA